MARDGRGNPGRIILKNQPRLRLFNVLRRRRSTLKSLLNELGITTYGGLDVWCGRMGIAPPSQAEFEEVMPPQQFVNNPQEGVVVLEAPSGTVEPLDVDDPSAADDLSVPGKKRRSRKDASS